jgi:hypothetical protein
MTGRGRALLKNVKANINRVAVSGIFDKAGSAAAADAACSEAAHENVTKTTTFLSR